MRTLRRAGRFVRRLLIVFVGVIVALFLYFVCQEMFNGYPEYYTNWLGPIAMGVIVITGGVAWLIDERRLDADDTDS